MASGALHVRTCAASADVCHTSPPPRRSCTRPWIYVWPLFLNFILCVNAMIKPVPENGLFACHAVLFRHPPGTAVFWSDHRKHARCAKPGKSVLHTGPCSLRRVAVAPQVAPNVISDLDFILAFNFLHNASAVAD